MAHSTNGVMPQIRAALASDAPHIAALVNSFAARNIMLPRSEEQVLAALPQFVIAEIDGELAGCGSLIALTPALAEIRSLAVASEHQGSGLGGVIVAALLDMARTQDYDQVCALTLRPAFFERQGFEIVDRWGLTPKIWQECVFCSKFHHCDETAMLLNLTEPAAESDEPRARPWRVNGGQPVFRLLPA
ncbi:MAG: GNAT family N-acetyltransferase [Caldilineales bacterium]